MRKFNENQARLDDFPHLIHGGHLNTSLNTGQCDCAFPDEIKKLRRPRLSESHTRFEKDIFSTFPLSGEYHAIVGRDSGFIALNASALNILDLFKKKNALENVKTIFRDCWDEDRIGKILIQMINLGLLIPDSEKNTEFEEKPDTLSAWLHVTDRCNLRCDYCYLPRKQTDMPYETGMAAIGAVFRSALIHGYETVQLKYGGGEPLLRFDSILEWHNYAKILGERNGITLNGVILSNGTCLTKTMIRQIKNSDFRLVVSLDGPKAFHDRSRVYKNGAGSYTDVSNAIDMALDAGLVPGISTTASSLTVNGLPELLDWISERDLPFRINFYRENRFSSSRTNLRLEEEAMVAGMLNAYKAIESKFPKRSLLGSLGDHADFFGPRKRPCNAGHSYMVLDSLGNVSKCQMEIHKTVANAGDPDPLGRIRESRTGLANPAIDEKPECRSCRWRHWCAGGCPIAAYRASGRYDAKSPNCGIYKRIFPEIIRLEGLRLLKSEAHSGLFQGRQQTN